jgi:phage terminase large subunit GpA-like protein
VLTWSGLQWPKDQPALAQYQCESCLALIPEHHKTQMLAAGQWIATYPERTTAGFHLNALYAPYGWVNSWAYLATEWTRIIHKRDRRQQQTFTNTNLAETGDETGEKLDQVGLAGRREVYPASCPDGVIVVTGAADVQDDRIEVECVGWGLDEESWSIDYQRFYGSPGQPAVWKLLDDWRKKTWTHECGVALKIIQLAIDTGGHHAKEAYAFVKKRQRERVVAVKGSNQPGHPLVGRPTKTNLGAVHLFSVGTDTAKDTLFSRLKLETFGPGYCHVPTAPSYDDEFFAQLTSEVKLPKYDKGVLQGTIYKKIRARNEALDLMVYNMAALAILNPNMLALAAQLEKKSVVSKPEQPAAPDEQPEAVIERIHADRHPYPRSRVRTGWIKRW